MRLEENNGVSLQQPEYVKQADENQQLMPTEAGATINLRQTAVRWLTLTISCLVLIGSYMSYDFASFLKEQVKATFHLKNDTQFNLIYSVYSLPNTVVPFVGGYIIDRLGIRVGNFVFVSIIFVGQAIVFVGSLIPNFVTLLVGRAIYSLGDENLGVCQSAIVSKWFYGKELGLAMGINVSFSRLGSVLSGWTLLPLYNINHKLWTPILFLMGMITFSFICANILNFVDKSTDEKEKALKTQMGIVEKEKPKSEEGINIGYLKEFPLIFWWIVLSCLLNYVCLFVFIFNAQQFLEKRYNIPEKQVTRYMTIPYLMSACLTPFIGLLVDKVGRRAFFLLGSSCIMALAHLLFLILPHNKVSTEKPVGVVNFLIPLILLGFFYSAYAAVLWPCIPIVLKEEFVGTGFGVATAVQNIGLTIVPLIYGAIDDDSSPKGQNATEIMFIAFGLVAILSAILIYSEDRRKNNSKLQQVIKKSKEDEQKEEDAQKQLTSEQ